MTSRWLMMFAFLLALASAALIVLEQRMSGIERVLGELAPLDYQMTPPEVQLNAERVSATDKLRSMGRQSSSLVLKSPFDPKRGKFERYRVPERQAVVNPPPRILGVMNKAGQLEALIQENQ